MKFAEIKQKNKLVNVVVIVFIFIYDVRNFWDNPHVTKSIKLLMNFNKLTQ